MDCLDVVFGLRVLMPPDKLPGYRNTGPMELNQDPLVVRPN